MEKFGNYKDILFYSLILIIAFSSCSKKVQKETEVYFNNFETNDLKGLSNGLIESFNGSLVLGRYNQSGFELLLSDLPQHDLVRISFDLFIHDSWDGNKTGIDNTEGPDLWQMLVDKKSYIYTTFSNTPCLSTWFCPTQSYPSNYLNNNNSAKTGAYKKDLPSACHPESSTTLYKITKTISHSKSNLLLECIDQLKQLDAEDPKCDESWSIDNLKISVITFW